MVDEASAEHPNRTLRPPSPEGAHGAAAASGRPKVRPDDEDETETETETGTMLSADVRARIEQMMQSLPDPSPPAVLGPTKPPRWH
jgi:DNA-directed RNA polymerase specialized sigma24 family protein